MTKPFVLIGGGFLAGALIASISEQNKHSIIIILCLGICLLALIFIKAKVKKTLALFTLCMIFGVISIHLKQIEYYNVVENYVFEDNFVVGQVKQITKRSGGRYTYKIEVTQIAQEKVQPFYVNIYTKTNQMLDYYDVVQFNTSLNIPTSNGDFDSVTYNKSKGIYLMGYNNNDIEVLSKNSNSLQYKIKNYNSYLAKILDKYLNKTQAGVLKSMLLGDDEDFAFDLEYSYEKVGVIHLFSISGLHLSILYTLIYFILIKLRFSKRISSAVVIGFIVFFIAVTGFNIPTIRAGIMVGVMLVGNIFRLRADSLNSLFIAGFFIVLINPYAIIDIGFQMSFLATFAIIKFYPILSDYIIISYKISDKFLQKIVSVACVSLAVNILLLPIYITAFKTISLIFIVSNLVVVPVATVILCVGFLFLILVNFEGIMFINIYIAKMLATLINLQNLIVENFAKLDFVTMGLSNKMFIQWLYLAVILLAIVLLIRKKIDLLMHSITVLVFLFFIINPYNLYLNNNKVKLNVLSDGSVSNIICTYNQNTIVILCGDNSYIDTLTLDTLNQNGITKIDYLILMYTSFRQYEDTINLINNMDIEYIYYNKNNVFAQDIMQDIKTNVIPIENMNIQIPNVLDIELLYESYNVQALLTIADTKMLISRYSDNTANTDYDFYFIRGQLGESVIELEDKEVVVLDKQYSDINSLVEYYYAANGSMTFDLGKIGVN